MGEQDDQVLAEVKPLTASRMMRDPVAHMPLSEVLRAWTWVDEIEKLCRARKEVLREQLLQAVKDRGTPDEKGSVHLTIAGSTITWESRGGKKVDGERLAEFLATRGLPPSAGFDEVRMQQANVSKIEALVETGHLSEEEVAILYTPASHALRVRKSAALMAQLEAAHLGEDACG